MCELTEMIGADTSTVSKHLSIPKNAGIIVEPQAKQGTTDFYSLEAPCLLRFIICVEQVIEQNIQKQLAGLQRSEPADLPGRLRPSRPQT